VTTLLDPKRYPKAKLAQLYHLRWQATEVNFKHLKTTLNMEMIWAKSPQMVRKEIWMHLLAYNLLRNLMWTSAELAQVPPMRISCKALQLLNHFIPTWRQRLPRSVCVSTAYPECSLPQISPASPVWLNPE